MNTKIPQYPILIVDDEEIMRDGLVEPLSAAGYDVRGVASAEEALIAFREKKYNILITDLRLPGMTGVELISKVFETQNDVVALVMTAYGTVESAVSAMKLGAFDYITKPFSFDAVRVFIQKMAEKLDLVFENERLKRELKGRYSFSNIIGKSKKMQEMFELIEKVSLSSATVIIYGESGTGKELIASAIHYNSARANKPYIKLNCAALPESLLESELFGYEKGAFTGALARKIGKFEAAEGGTIFLDEIGDIAPEIQVKLLRVLQEREFTRVGGIDPIKIDVRIICATNANLQKKVAENKFREDLYYRLNVIPFFLPPLRERKEDIPLLVNHFIAKFNKENGKGFKNAASDVLKLFMECPWPGNIRQLENTIERIVVLNSGDVINYKMVPLDFLAEVSKTSPGVYQAFNNSEIIMPAQHVSAPAGSERSAPEAGSLMNSKEPADENSAAEAGNDDFFKAPVMASVEEIEKLHIANVLKKSNYNISKASRILNIDRKTLYMKMEKYGLERKN